MQIQLLAIKQTNINELNEVTNLKEENYIKQDKNTFLFKALEVYKKEEYKENLLTDDIIKVMLPSDEDEAKEQWFKGITIEDVKYFGWFATVGGIKQENEHDKEKCEAFFIREDLKPVCNWFEQLISLGQFKLLKDKKIYVNKQVLSRMSLTTSTLITQIYMPNVIILPSAKLKFKRTYTTVIPKEIEVEVVNEKTGEITAENQIEYSLEDYNFDDDIDIFDGGGIATPAVMDTIGQSLNRNDIDFAIIRGYGTAIKGLVTRFDIIKYLDTVYKEDTTIADENKFCKKVDGYYYLKDMYGKWREVTDNTLLLNESMVKLADLFANEVKDADKEIITTQETYGMDLINKKLETRNNEKHINEYNLLNKLYITKVNKKDCDLTDYRALCYQLFNALALTENEYKQLAEQDFKLFKKLIRPFSAITKDDAKTEFEVNSDYINLYFRNITKQIINESEENEEEKELDEISLNHTDKTAILIQLNKENVNFRTVKKQMARMLEKRIRKLACGKVTTKANYCYIAIDPISYMNFAMTREQGDNGLKAGQFYFRKYENDKQVTIYRNPLMAFSEIHNIKLIRNNFFDNWLCKSNELIYFNQKSDIYSLCGSADSDGDSVTIIDNEIIAKGVIKTDKPFFFTADGKKIPNIYNNEAKFECSYKPSGNLIGSVSTLATVVNTYSQTLPKYYSPDSNKFYYYDEVLEILAEHKYEGITKDSDYDKVVKPAIDKIIKEGYLMYSNSNEIDTEIVREQLKKQFLEDCKNIYSLLHTSSLVIDTPKTMNIINRDMYIKPIEKLFYNKEDDARIFKPYFLQYKKYSWEIGKKETYSSYTYNFLDEFAEKVQKEILNSLENNKKVHDGNDKAKVLQKQLENNKYDKDKFEECMQK
ncbi:hypothetical protein [Clostridium saccharobutylicum]|nr:hypothetical protein [Clostridium saccharobutylicum]